jgi:hypothetical protein
MNKSQHRNTRNMNKHGNMTPLKVLNSTITIEMVEKPLRKNSKVQFKK